MKELFSFYKGINILYVLNILIMPERMHDTFNNALKEMMKYAEGTIHIRNGNK
jgi:hypothetical protein